MAYTSTLSPEHAAFWYENTLGFVGAPLSTVCDESFKLFEKYVPIQLPTPYSPVTSTSSIEAGFGSPSVCHYDLTLNEVYPDCVSNEIDDSPVASLPSFPTIPGHAAILLTRDNGNSVPWDLPSSGHHNLPDTGMHTRGDGDQPSQYPGHLSLPSSNDGRVIVATEVTIEHNILKSNNREHARADYSPGFNVTNGLERGSKAQQSNDGGKVRRHDQRSRTLREEIMSKTKRKPKGTKKAQKSETNDTDTMLVPPGQDSSIATTRTRTRFRTIEIYRRLSDGRTFYMKTPRKTKRGEAKTDETVLSIPERFRLYQRRDHCWVVVDDADVIEHDAEEHNAIDKIRGYLTHSGDWMVVRQGKRGDKFSTFELLLESLHE